MSFQTEKDLLRAHHAALAQATPDTVEAALARHTAPNWHWRGMHPWHELTGAPAVAQAFWAPVLADFTRLQRREDIFFAGANGIDDGASVWVVSMGHLMGLFDGPWLGLRPTGRIAMLRYAEFHRVSEGQIVETAQFLDLLHLLRQVGQYPLGPQTGAHLIQPGPATHDGLLYAPQDPGEGRTTLALIERMIASIGAAAAYASPQQELAETWADDMIWWGPEGIGATYTIERYIAQHQRPFRRQAGPRRFNGHIARLAEGNFGGFFGWPNLTMTPVGGFLGMTGTGTAQADLRVVDLYRRAGDRLVENWVFIDMLHFLNMQGLDVLARLRETA